MSSTFKQLLTAGQFEGALLEFAREARSTRDPNVLLGLSKGLSKIPREEFDRLGYTTKKMAVLNGYTSGMVLGVAKSLLAADRILIETFETGFGLFEQAIRGRDAELAAFQPDLAYFCVGLENLGPSGDLELERWRSLWQATHEFLGCEILQNTFEEPQYRVLGNFETKWEPSRTNQVKRLNAALASVAPPFVHFCDINAAAAYHGRKLWRDDRYYDLAKMPVSSEHLWDYADTIVSVTRALLGRSRKCLVLDLDNTLWGGIVGDDGADRVAIGEDSGPGEAFTRFQTYVKALKERGVILAVCSKNEEALAKAPFLTRSEMVLKLDDISCFVANWEPKTENLAAIARSLNIGLDSLVFVDDNPAERELVRRFQPEVRVIDVPDDPAGYVRALSEANCFETVSITAEDLRRSQQYRSNLERERAASGVADYPAYLKGLEMRAQLGSIDFANLARVTQLINKTNQFNLTTKRYTESEVSRFAENPEAVTRYVKLSDKFGDHGLISVFMAKMTLEPRGKTLVIDNWLMSCRVLKRGVEDLLFQVAVREALKQGCQWIEGLYMPTPKNALVKELYRELGFVLAPAPATAVGGQTWIFDLAHAERSLAREVFIEC